VRNTSLNADTYSRAAQEVNRTRRRFHQLSLEKDLGDLLTTLCVEWGFCILPSRWDRIGSIQRLTADEFAAEVLEAEGFNLDYDAHLYRKIKRSFIERFGEVGSADAYRRT
jgi:hypothetical protein